MGGCSSESPNDTLKIKLTKRRQSIAGKSTEETALENLSLRIPVQVQDPDTENDSDNDFDEPTDDDILDNEQQVLQEPDTADADDKVDNDDDADNEKSKTDLMQNWEVQSCGFRNDNIFGQLIQFLVISECCIDVSRLQEILIVVVLGDFIRQIQ